MPSELVESFQHAIEAITAKTAVMSDKRGSDSREKTLACQEMEARQEEEPTSVATKPEVAQIVPAEDAEVIPVGEPKEKRPRERKLAAERRRQEPKNLSRAILGPQTKSTVVRRGTNHRANVARKTQTDGKRSRHTTVARLKRNIFRESWTPGDCVSRMKLAPACRKVSRRAAVTRLMIKHPQELHPE